jgi:hypothetical protein
LALAGVICFSSLVAALGNGNSTYRDIDMLRSKLALMEDRPSGCPPW